MRIRFMVSVASLAVGVVLGGEIRSCLSEDSMLLIRGTVDKLPSQHHTQDYISL